MAESTIRQELDQRGRGFFQTAGDSMEPLLHHHYSTVVIEKPAGRLKPWDAALYRRPSGQYILHRVVKVREDGYLIRGDNRYYNEYVPEDWVIGVMTGFFNGDAYTSCGDPDYLAYVKTLPRRYAALWCRAFPGRAAGKLKRMFFKRA